MCFTSPTFSKNPLTLFSILTSQKTSKIGTLPKISTQFQKLPIIENNPKYQGIHRKQFLKNFIPKN